MKLGFTGTRKGVTLEQRKAVAELIASLKPKEFHHGDCVGSDEEVHALIREHAVDCKVVIHPPLIDAARAYCEGDEVRPSKAYLSRNRDIVNATDALAATPGEPYEVLRSGTWSTVRFAAKVGKRVHLVLPGGGITVINP